MVQQQLAAEAQAYRLKMAEQRREQELLEKMQLEQRMKVRS